MTTDVVGCSDGDANDSALRKISAIHNITDITVEREVIAGNNLFQRFKVRSTSHN